MVDKSVNQQVLGGIMLNPQYLSEIDKYNLSIGTANLNKLNNTKREYQNYIRHQFYY